MRAPEYFGSMPPADVLLGAACNPDIAFLFEPLTKTGAEGCTDDSIQEGRKRQALAVEICNRCPVKSRCFEDAVMHQREGVYGGVSMTKRWHRQRRLDSAA